MDRQNYKHHFEILELTTEARAADIKKAYLLLKEIYSTDSLAVMSIPEEISPEQTKEILQQIENSYQILSEMFNNEENTVTKFIDQITVDITNFNGATLRDIRHKLDISLDDMALETRVDYKHLVTLEKDNFAELPVAVYTRGFVVNYAKFLALDPEVVVKSYMANFQQYLEKNVE